MRDASGHRRVPVFHRKLYLPLCGCPVYIIHFARDECCPPPRDVQHARLPGYIEIHHNFDRPKISPPANVMISRPTTSPGARADAAAFGDNDLYTSLAISLCEGDAYRENSNVSATEWTCKVDFFIGIAVVIGFSTVVQLQRFFVIIFSELNIEKWLNYRVNLHASTVKYNSI